MHETDLRKMQLIQLEMLTEFDRICRKYEIEYFIIAGTLLGAVRHGGFIPWDDDVDVAMKRRSMKNFAKFAERTFIKGNIFAELSYGFSISVGICKIAKKEYRIY